MTGGNSWYFPDTGIEFTAVGGVTAPTAGTPLYSAMGDIGGFGHSTLTFSPAAGHVSGGSASTTDYAGANPLDAVIAGNLGTNKGSYTTNGGISFTNFAANPGGGTAYTDGSIAESANGSTIAWAPSGQTAYYTTNNGSSWVRSSFGSITSLTASGTTATAVTSSASGFQVGQSISISGANQTNFNGTFTIASIVNTTTFTFAISKFTVSSLTQTGGVATAVTSAANGFQVGNSVVIAGATPAAYNGTFTIASIVNSTTFTYAVAAGTASPATGTITAIVNTASGTMNAALNGGIIVSDKVNPNYFYYWVENSSDNNWELYISSNAGQTFAPSGGGTLGTGNVTLAANPYVAGQLWISSYIGMYESTNFGAGFSHVGSVSPNVTTGNMALGASAPGTSIPAIYIYGTVPGNSFAGIFRSDDGGNSWAQINDTAHQWGGLIQALAADPNVFGRVYIGINGRGIIMGNPVSSLPANWSDADINSPGNPGWATNSTALSSGSVINQWSVEGGGAGYSAAPVAITSLSVSGNVATATSTVANGFQVGQTVTISGASPSVFNGTFVITGLANTAAGITALIGSATQFTFALVAANGSASGTISATLADQFNFAYEPITGGASISAQLLSLTNADNGLGTPLAGVMFRAGTNPNDVFIEMAQTTANGLVLEYRTTSGGALTTVSLGGVSVGTEYIEVIRSGNNFSGYYSVNGISWTQLGSTVIIAAMPATANLGLASSASYNPQLTRAVFANVVVNLAPTVATPANANSTSVAGNTVTLNVVGSDDGSEANLNYTWSASGPAAVSYTPINTNGTHAGQNLTAHFTMAGSYTFTATITDALGLSTTSGIGVNVQATPTAVVVTPSTNTVAAGSTAQFSAMVTDQFSNSISSPTISWSITGTANGNSIDGNGLAMLGSTGGTYTVTATAGAASNAASIVDVPTVYSDTSGTNTYSINLNQADPTMLQIVLNTQASGAQSYMIALAKMPSLTFLPGSGTDSLTVDFTNGSPVPSGGVTISGGTGVDSLFIGNSAGTNSISVGNNKVVFNGFSITYGNVQNLTISTGGGDDALTQTAQPGANLIFNGGSGSDTLTVQSGSYSFAGDPAAGTANLSVFDNSSVIFPAATATTSPLHLAAMNIGSNGMAQVLTAVSPSNRDVLITGGLTIAATGLLDLGGNDLVAMNTLSGLIFSALKSGFNAGLGYWNGASGIISSAAANDATFMHTLGQGVGNGNGFDGVNPGSADSLVMYTLYGDADLNGALNGADYQQIDQGFGSQSSGWSNGDFNYDALVNGSDFSLIDNAFNQQAASAVPAGLIATPAAKVAEISAVSAPVSDAANWLNADIRKEKRDLSYLFAR